MTLDIQFQADGGLLDIRIDKDQVQTTEEETTEVDLTSALEGSWSVAAEAGAIGCWTEAKETSLGGHLRRGSVQQELVT